MPELRLSVVVPTFNRRPRLARVLAAFEAQVPADGSFEVIVVDDGSTDGTGDWLENQQRRYPLRHLRLPNGGPARARNAGVEAASGQLILFVDDDVEPCPTLVAEHLRCHEAEQDVVVMGPLASLPSYAQPWVAWEQEMVEQQYAAMQRGDWAPTFRQFWTGNASLARAHILSLGGFDVDFKRGEDVELGIRLHKRGLGFRFNPLARGLHHAERSLKSWEDMHTSYGRVEVAIFSQVSEAFMLETLSGNWQRLNPALRVLVSQCLKHPLLSASTRAALRSHLQLARHRAVPVVTSKVCSVLSNLLYWEASFAELGPERAEHVRAATRP